MNKVAKILNELNFDYFTDGNYVWIDDRQIYIKDKYVYFSHKISETRLSVNNPMLKTWIRDYIVKGKD